MALLVNMLRGLLFNSLSAAGSVLVPWSNVYCLDVNYVRYASANLTKSINFSSVAPTKRSWSEDAGDAATGNAVIF